MKIHIMQIYECPRDFISIKLFSNKKNEYDALLSESGACLRWIPLCSAAISLLELLNVCYNFLSIHYNLFYYEHICLYFDMTKPSILLFLGLIATHQSHTNSEERTSLINSVSSIINSKTLFFFDIIFYCGLYI